MLVDIMFLMGRSVVTKTHLGLGILFRVIRQGRTTLPGGKMFLPVFNPVRQILQGDKMYLQDMGQVEAIHKGHGIRFMGKIADCIIVLVVEMYLSGI